MSAVRAVQLIPRCWVAFWFHYLFRIFHNTIKYDLTIAEVWSPKVPGTQELLSIQGTKMFLQSLVVCVLVMVWGLWRETNQQNKNVGTSYFCKPRRACIQISMCHSYGTILTLPQYVSRWYHMYLRWLLCEMETMRVAWQTAGRLSSQWPQLYV